MFYRHKNSNRHGGKPVEPDSFGLFSIRKLCVYCDDKYVQTKMFYKDTPMNTK